MLGSENHYFTQSALKLSIGRVNVIDLLTIKGYNSMSIETCLKAFDYFVVNNNDFDGATLTKDLCDLPDLDLDAMCHDFWYIKYNVASSVIMKWRADKLYAKGNEYKGKGLYSAYSRLVGLTLSGIGFTPFARISRGKMTEFQKTEFMHD